MAQKFTTASTEEEKEEAVDLLNYYTKDIHSADELVDRYSETSEQYDKNLHILNYKAPAKLAEVLCEVYPSNRENVKILDVAAGTGLCADECHKAGFRKFDAVDASQGMLQEARKKGLYERYYTASLGDDVLDIPDDSYDAITMCGLPAWVMRALPRSGVEELIRLVKPGGYVMSASNITVYDDDSNYKQHTEDLESQRRWQRVQLRTFLNFAHGKDGVVAVHKVL